MLRGANWLTQTKNHTTEFSIVWFLFVYFVWKIISKILKIRRRITNTTLVGIPWLETQFFLQNEHNCYIWNFKFGKKIGVGARQNCRFTFWSKIIGNFERDICIQIYQHTYNYREMIQVDNTHVNYKIDSFRLKKSNFVFFCNFLQTNKLLNRSQKKLNQFLLLKM